MKVTHARSRLLSTPADNPLVVGLDQPGTREFVTLELNTDDGVEGTGITFFGANLTPALRSAVDSLAELVIGEDPMRVEAVVGKLRRAASGAGPGGIFTLALSAIDLALWDIKGKALGQTLNAMAGGARDRVNTYASGALMRPHPTHYLRDAGQRLVEMGFKQMKTQLGAERTVTESVERIKTLREAIGEDIDLMCDINQLWNVNQAIEIGTRVAPYHLFWLEDVVAADDYQGLARVADALTTPIATGEYVYGITPHRQLIEHRSVDIVMIDLWRVGGVTQWLKVAGMAEAFDLPVVSHLIPEVQCHLISAIPHGLTVEYMPWSMRLWEETPEIVDGQIVVPDRPGLGLKLSAEAIERYEVK